MLLRQEAGMEREKQRWAGEGEESSAGVLGCRGASCSSLVVSLKVRSEACH